MGKVSLLVSLDSLRVIELVEHSKPQGMDGHDDKTHLHTEEPDLSSSFQLETEKREKLAWELRWRSDGEGRSGPLTFRFRGGCCLLRENSLSSFPAVAFDEWRCAVSSSFSCSIASKGVRKSKFSLLPGARACRESVRVFGVDVRHSARVSPSRNLKIGCGLLEPITSRRTRLTIGSGCTELKAKKKSGKERRPLRMRRKRL
jgi:hypothetical protein